MPEAPTSVPSSDEVPATGCPRVEPIAALLDRQLRGNERQELLDHLAECEVCYGVFAATSQVLSAEHQVPRSELGNRGLLRRYRRALWFAVVALLGAVLWQAVRAWRPRLPAAAGELAISLGTAGRAIPIATRSLNAASRLPGVEFGRAELHLAVALLERRTADALAAAKRLVDFAAMSPNAADPAARSLREGYLKWVADLERGRVSAAPAEATAVLFPLRELAAGRCLEAAEHAAGGGAWFATETARTCRDAVARLKMPGIDRVLAAWPEVGTPDALALANALATVGEPGLAPALP